MHFSTPIILALLGVTGAFRIPEGTPDGIYSIEIDADGQEVLTKTADLLDLPVQPLSESAGAVSRLTKRAGPGSKKNIYMCYPYTLNRNDIERAATNLGNTCDQGAMVKKNNYQAAVSGNAVVVACNFSGYHKRRCYSQSVNQYVGQIENWCPTNRAGEWQVDPPIHSDGVTTYGYTAQGQQFCHNYAAGSSSGDAR